MAYYHVVFTLPAAIGAIAYQNKAVVYSLLFKAASETLLTIAADPRHLGARIGMTAVLHSWGSALTHHPHVHMIVPGGGLSPGGERFIPCRHGFFLPVRVLSRLFRRLMIEKLAGAYDKGQLILLGSLAKLATGTAFADALKPLRRMNWFVYAKRPFAGPKAVLAYLSRYTHRVAISNTRLIADDARGVTFRYKDYRAEGSARQKVMTLPADEFIRRFLIHVLPKGFHRIRQNLGEIKCLSSECTFAPPFIPLFLKTVKFTLANLMAGVTCALHNGVFWRIAANLLSPNLCN
jgi:hypothetical protein